MIVDTARAAAELLAPMVAGRTGVAVLHLDPDGRLIDISLAEAGGAELPVRDIVAAALRLGSAALVVARGHAGAGEASDSDEEAAARRLAEAAAAVGIRLVDHLVFDGGECRSFRELRLL